MTPAAEKPGDGVADREGAGSASGRMIVEDRATDDGPAVVVHVEDTISRRWPATKASSTRARRCRAQRRSRSYGF